MDFRSVADLDIERLESCQVNLEKNNSKRPKSLIEMSVKNPCNFLYRHSADLSNKKLALFVLKISKTTLPYRKRHKNDVLGHVDHDQMVTWGSNGKNLAGLANYLSGGSPYRSMEGEIFSNALKTRSEELLVCDANNDDILNSVDCCISSSTAIGIDSRFNGDDHIVIVKEVIDSILGMIETQQNDQNLKDQVHNMSPKVSKIAKNQYVAPVENRTMLGEIEIVLKELISKVVNNVDLGQYRSADHQNSFHGYSIETTQSKSSISDCGENSTFDKIRIDMHKSVINPSSEKLIEPSSRELQRGRDQLKPPYIVSQRCGTLSRGDVNLNFDDELLANHDRNFKNAERNSLDRPKLIKRILPNGVSVGDDGGKMTVVENDGVCLENGIVGNEIVYEDANISFESEYSIEEHNITVIENLEFDADIINDVDDDVTYVLDCVLNQVAPRDNIICDLVNDIVQHVCFGIDTSHVLTQTDVAAVVTTHTRPFPSQNGLHDGMNRKVEIDTTGSCSSDETESCSSMESLDLSAQFQLSSQRPSTLEIGQWKSESKLFSFLKSISSEDLTPVAHYSSLGDIFSEESELALEEALIESSDSENEFPANLGECVPDDHENDIAPYSNKTRSLPANFVPDYSQYQNNQNTPSCGINAFLKTSSETRSKRDSAMSRESAASSGTVVASDDEMDSLETSYNHDTVVSSHGLSVPGVNNDISGGVGEKVFAQKRRSKSLDRNQLLVIDKKPHPIKATSSTAIFHRKNHSDDVMIKAPTITITPDSGGITFYNGVTSSKHSRASSFASLSSKHSSQPEEYELSAWSSPSSSLSSSPTSSPLLVHPDGTRIRHKALRDRETRIAERQAADACKWLRAAGFPQYAHLYEVGTFPVDLESVGLDHDFLGQEHIAALIRRLNVLNKCANLKLDKSLSKEAQTDEEDEDEQCAISELWHLDGANRWSRLDSKSSLQDGSIEGSHPRTPSSGAVSNLPHLHEEDEREVFRAVDNKRQPRQTIDLKNEDARAAHEFARRIQQSNSSGHLDVDGKKSIIKSKSFLKRVGLEKFGSFRRKEHVLLRTHSSEDTIDIKRSNKNRHLNAKSFRKNRKLTIGQPTLQSGHEKVDRMKCIPIDGPKDTNNTQSRLRKNSCQSLISSSSSSASGSTSASSTPAFRTRAEDDITTRSDPGDLCPISPGILERNRNILDYSSRVRAPAQTSNPEQNIFVIPKTHVPGKFPTAIRKANEEDDLFQASSEISSRNPSSSDSAQPIPDEVRKSVRPGSVYDNIPASALGGASAQDIIDILDPSTSGVNDSGVYTVGSMESLDNSAPDTAFWSVDEIVEQTESLKNFVSTWEADDDQKSTSTSIETLDRLFPSTQEALSSFSTENIAHGDDESENINLSNYHQTRPLPKDRWVNNRHIEQGTNSLQLHSLSVGQLMILRRLSLLKLTALMESYASNHNNKGTINWSVPRFIRRIKVPDYKDKGVFGVPLLHNVQRFGQPLPQCIHHALLYLRRTALDQVGLFRKPGVKSRIRRLRNMCENNPSLKSFEDCTPFDVADMVKQFFRDLPDPLMTMKMSETFVGIFLYVPTELRLQTLQAATMLLPDEVRETLKTLLCFLSDVAFRSSENHMNEANLATCFAPSLFYHQLNTARTMTSASSPKSRKQPSSKVGGIALGRPDMKEMNENMAANQCLAFMIQEVNSLFKISEDAMTQCRMSVMQQTEDVLAAEIGYSCDPGKEEDFYKDFHQYVDRTVAQTVREEQRISQNKGGWQTVPSAHGSELMFKKMNDGNHLRMWRCQVEVPDSTPSQIMERIIQERHVWDENLAQWKVLQRPDDRTQIFQAVVDEMSPHPSRDYCVLRSWRTDVNDKGALAIIETSTAQQTLLGDVRGVVLTSRYLIEPVENSQKCLLTHVSRVDTKGRNPEWYNKAFGHVKVQQLLQIKKSLKKSRASFEG